MEAPTTITTIREFSDADGKPVQPYFAAFMLEQGFARRDELWERDGHSAEYIFWNHDRWSEYRSFLGLSEDTPITAKLRDEFTDFLQARVDRLLGREAA